MTAPHAPLAPLRDGAPGLRSRARGQVGEELTDLFEDVGEDLLDPLEALAQDATAEAREEQAEIDEEAAEEELEAEEEEEEAEEEAAEEVGYLRGASIYRDSLWKRAALCALRARTDCDYYRHERMSPEWHVPETYYGTRSPPFYYGPNAVPVGSPLLVATAEHYAERETYAAVEQCRGALCANISVHPLAVERDRYELLPAAALIAPEAIWRWPLQLRIHSAVVYAEPATTPLALATLVKMPPLISFTRLGFVPAFTAFSSAEGAIIQHGGRVREPRRQGNESLASLVIFLAVAVVIAAFAYCKIFGEDLYSSPTASPASTRTGSPDPPSRPMSPDLSRFHQQLTGAPSELV